MTKVGQDLIMAATGIDALIEQLRGYARNTTYGNTPEEVMHRAADALAKLQGQADGRWDSLIEAKAEIAKLRERENRVCDYILELTNNEIGCGDDPIGFLIASHGSLRAEIAKLQEINVKQADRKDAEIARLRSGIAKLQAQEKYCEEEHGSSILALQLEAAKLREALEKIAYPPDDIDAPHYPISIARAALGEKK